VTLKYTALGYNTTNKPALTGSLDDDFTTAAATTACTTGGVAYGTNWTCLQGSAANTAGAFNAEDTAAAGSGDSSSWLRLSNQTTTTAAVPSDFGTTPSNTFLYQTMPTSYADGSITTVVNSTATFGVGATTPTTPFNHVGLVLWTSNTDYLELQEYSTAATTGTNSVDVALNNSGTIGTAVSLNASTTAGTFGEVWLRMTNTVGSWQAQYSTDGTTWNNVGSAVVHTTAFTRVGLNAFTKIASPVSTYAGAFEWFQYNLANPTYNQVSYQWFGNADSVTPAASLNSVAQNTATTLTSTGQAFRLRQLIKSSGLVGATSKLTTTETIADSTANSGNHAATLGNDGFIRAVQDLNGSGTAIYRACTNSTCSSSTSSTLEAASAIGRRAIVTAPDGFSRIAGTTGISTISINVYQCTNASCSTFVKNTVDTGTSTQTVDSVSIAIGSDGFPRVAYIFATASAAVKFAQCADASCSTGTVLTTVATGATSYRSVKLIMSSADGFAGISYMDASNNLVYIKCSNASCSSKTTTTIATNGNATSGESLETMTQDASGQARIAYYTNDTVARMAYVHCTANDCSTFNSSIVDSSASGGSAAGAWVSMRPGPDGFDRIAYHPSGSTIRYITCSNDDCTSLSSNDFTTSINTGVGNNVYINPVSNASSIATYQNTNNNFTVLDINNNYMFKLQYAQTATCSSGAYSDVTSSSAIAFNDNATPADGTSITYQSGTDPTDSGQTVAGESYQESGQFINTAAFGNTVDGEWDFSLTDNGATAGTAYCFRVASFDGTSTSALTTYTNYPMITTFGSAGPTMDQIMRGGEWFSSGTKQPFFWAN
jgi:hypothetical protein